MLPRVPWYSHRAVMQIRSGSSSTGTKKNPQNPPKKQSAISDSFSKGNGRSRHQKRVIPSFDDNTVPDWFKTPAPQKNIKELEFSCRRERDAKIWLKVSLKQLLGWPSSLLKMWFSLGSRMGRGCGKGKRERSGKHVWCWQSKWRSRAELRNECKHKGRQRIWKRYAESSNKTEHRWKVWVNV